MNLGFRWPTRARGRVGSSGRGEVTRVIASLVARRLILTIPVVLGITLYVFVILQFSPIDPRYTALGIYASPAQRAAFAKEYHLNDPIYVRYPKYLDDLAHGNLGISTEGVKVSTLVGEALPITASLALLALVGALVIALVFGVTSAYLAGGWWDALVRTFSFGGLSMPTFWLGLILIQLFALAWPILPAGGYVPFARDPVAWLESLILPALTLAIPIGGFLTRVVRSSVLDELDRDYVRTAKGGGLPDRIVLWNNVLRNALAGPLNVFGLQAGYLLSGAVLVEVVFNLPGVGFLAWQASQQGDFGVILGIALIAALVYVATNLIVDIVYLILTPRARKA